MNMPGLCLTVKLGQFAILRARTVHINGYRIETKKLKPGDFIYIMGLKMVVGSNYIALNNPDEKLKIKSDSIGIGRTQVARNSDENIPEQPEKQFFSRSPCFRKRD